MHRNYKDMGIFEYFIFSLFRVSPPREFIKDSLSERLKVMAPDYLYCPGWHASKNLFRVSSTITYAVVVAAVYRGIMIQKNNRKKEIV